MLIGIKCACGNRARWWTVLATNELKTDGLCVRCALATQQTEREASEYTVEKLISKLQTFDPKMKVLSNDDEYGPWVVTEIREDWYEGRPAILLDR